MRPQKLFALFAPITTLPGVGPKLAQRFQVLLNTPTTPRIIDLISHKPVDIIDRSHAPKINELVENQIATVTIRVGKHQPSHSKRTPYRVTAFDDTGEIDIPFFHAHQDYIQEALPVGEVRVISGKIDFYKNRPQMPHPDFIVPLEQRKTITTIQPLYALTAGLSNNLVHKTIQKALDTLPTLPEWLDETLLKREKWQSWRDAVIAMHAPQQQKDITFANMARQRLAYDELLANQLVMALVRHHHKKTPGRTIKSTGTLRHKILSALPFTLTKSQQNAVQEIDADMANPHRMLRLLQGDVGSGKTVVALLAMASAIENNAQAALLAPTEILAQQHYENLTSIIPAQTGISCALLTGSIKGKKREQIYADLAAGKIDILIGTHAIFQESVLYKDLAMAVIDEQHRFGVNQRLALANKTREHNLDILSMTATPIPRTLLLAFYGDMTCSQLTEKPIGRKEITTKIVTAEKMDELVDGLHRQINKGESVYWVCPLVEESEMLNLTAATTRYEELQKTFGNQVGLIHGKMKSSEKENIMQDFQNQKIKILVATTVIEVGVDVKHATIMVIEHADRFGLAQLHQLRGRIGRNDKQSTCLLLYDGFLSETAKRRLTTLRNSNDGFFIAEEDYHLRGAGDVLGTRQSGLPDFKFADFYEHRDLLEIAQKDAALIIDADPVLQSPRGETLRMLLHLFERDQAVRYLQSG